MLNNGLSRPLTPTLRAKRQLGKTPLLVFVMVALTGCGGSSGGGSISPEVTDTSAGDSVDVDPADQQNNAVPTAHRLMAAGDSITHGLIDPGPSASWRLPFTKLLDKDGCAYQMVGSQTTNALHNAFESPHEGYASHEAGHFVTGFTNWAGVNDGIFVSMQSYDADVVLLHVGTNDAVKGQSNQETVQEIDQIVTTILDANGDVLVANVIPSYTEAFLDGVDAHIDELATLIEAYVAQLSNPRVQLVDVRNGYSSDLMFDDGIHPNDAGSQHIAEAFYRVYSLQGYCL